MIGTSYLLVYSLYIRYKFSLMFYSILSILYADFIAFSLRWFAKRTIGKCLFLAYFKVYNFA